MKSGEFDLIDKIRKQFPVPDNITGIGDDCAVIPQELGFETLITTDLLVEGIHFLKEDAAPFDLGWKSAAVNISDIAGMGGNPAGSFLSLALPKNLDDTWTDAFINGYKTLSNRYDCPLLGGDTSSSIDRIFINVTVVGKATMGKSLKRSAALPGDGIYVTGTLGDSAAGLKIILSGKSNRTELEKILVERHYRPVPRVEDGEILAGIEGVHAMMDISDGIGSDLRHILKASGVSARIDTESIPLSDEFKKISSTRGWDPLELAISGGEDYELLFTASPRAENNILREIKCHRIGTIIERGTPTVEWIGSSKDFQGFKHF